MFPLHTAALCDVPCRLRNELFPNDSLPLVHCYIQNLQPGLWRGVRAGVKCGGGGVSGMSRVLDVLHEDSSVSALCELQKMDREREVVTQKVVLVELS